MPFTPLILWTDALLWLLVAATGAYLWLCARRPHLAAPWLRVARRRAALASLAVLAGYGAVGLAGALVMYDRMISLGRFAACFAVILLSLIGKRVLDYVFTTVFFPYASRTRNRFDDLMLEAIRKPARTVGGL